MIEELKSKNIIQSGHFKLKSGDISKVYINLKKVISYPELHLRLCNEIIKKLNPNINLICGIPYGATSFASYISIVTNTPMLFLRKEPKTHGTNKLIEGEFTKGQKVTLIEDVTTTGNSIIESARKLEEYGLIISQVITVFSRSQNRNLMFQALPFIYTDNNGVERKTVHNKVPIEYLYHIDDIKDKQTINAIIKKKQTKICLAADVNHMIDLFNLIDLIGDYICILKIHSDIITDFHTNYEYNKDKLNYLKSKYNFQIWEDGKFADIGFIMNRKIHTHISEWSDIISIHPISGMKSLREIKDIDIILIGEMSSEDHLMNKTYQDEVIKIAEQSNNVIGIVCQHKMSNQLLNIVPGISFSKSNDQQGQIYNTPEIKDFADIYVIGRDIYKSKDPKTSIINYISYIND